MLALIAGRGQLPVTLHNHLVQRGIAVLICELRGQPSAIGAAAPRLMFRLERLGGLVNRLRKRGVTEVCMAGGIDRPTLNPLALDIATLKLIPQIRRALEPGDDGALRAIISVFEDAGIRVVGASDIAPELLARAGRLTRAEPGAIHRKMALMGDAALADMAAGDIGQACIIGPAGILALEGPDGTDALIGRQTWPKGAVLFKSPKPGQDRRADLPAIGPATAQHAAEAGLDGIIVEAGGVLVLDQAAVIAAMNEAGLFLWARERPE